MERTISRVLAISMATSLFLALIPQTSYGKDSTTVQDLQPPPWPFQLLDRAEREARLRFVLGTQNYHVEKAREPMTTELCNNLLKKLDDLTDVRILEPDLIAQSRDDASVPDNLIEHCSTVEIDRVWHSWEKGPLSAGVDPAFDELSLGQKDVAADFYDQKTEPIEFYDVSRYFDGRKTWATFTEGGRVVCNVDRNLCSELEGYQLRSGVVVGAVVDAETCTQHLPSKVKASGRLLTSTAHPYAFRELPSFYAYAEIDGDKLYRLGLASSVPYGDFDRLMQLGGTTLIAEPANTKKGGLCVYETKQEGE